MKTAGSGTNDSNAFPPACQAEISLLSILRSYIPSVTRFVLLGNSMGCVPRPQIISHTQWVPVIFLLFVYFSISLFCVLILSLRITRQPARPTGEANNLEGIESRSC